jgi:hypothetical protein
MKPFLLAFAAVQVVALLLNIVAVTSDCWAATGRSDTGVAATMGLWRLCIDVDDGTASGGSGAFDVSRCYTISSDTECSIEGLQSDLRAPVSLVVGACPKVNATRAMAVLSVLVGVLACIAQVYLSFFNLEQLDHKKLGLISGGLGLLCALFGLLTMSVWADFFFEKLSDRGYHHAFSFAFCVMSWLFHLLGSMGFVAWGVHEKTHRKLDEEKDVSQVLASMCGVCGDGISGGSPKRRGSASDDSRDSSDQMNENSVARRGASDSIDDEEEGLTDHSREAEE